MKKNTIMLIALLLGGCAFLGYHAAFTPNKNELIAKVSPAEETDPEEEEHEGYDGPGERDLLEFEKTKDPALNRVPYERLLDAVKYTTQAKASLTFRGQSVLWQERGPIYDSVGNSNGNKRGAVTGNPPGTYTSGRIRAVIVDASDASGNTVWCGGVAGGVWKCTNFLATEPNWVAVNDNFLNLAVSSICQDPSNTDVMYFATGEPTSNADAVLGRGIWKSTDHGVSWTQLASTTSFTRVFKVVCNAAGNVFLATRGSGLRRSKDGGASFADITPTGASNICSDIEIASTNRMHTSFGYGSGAATHHYTDNSGSASSATWVASTGLPTGGSPVINRLELATAGNVVYGITTSSANNITATWRSTDGGTTFVRMNATDYTSSLTNTQGWYNISLAINPSNASDIFMAGLDMYRSVDAGASIVRSTYWVSSAPYVHADHHNTIWYNAGVESRIIEACDGGLFYSNNGGLTWTDKNKNLGIKQFYSCAIRPEAGSNYIIAGAQDNGTHQISNPGLTYSIEVTGGDGAYCDISQTNPNLQFGAYVYNQYRRSINGGTTWSSINFSSTVGRFINPFDYDELSDALYASYGANTVLRWNTPGTGTTSNTFTVTGLGTPSAITASPFTLGTVFIGSGVGNVFKVTDANTATSVAATATNITGAGMTGYISSIAVGTEENTLAVVMSNYGVNNVWFTTNGGTSWSQIDGNLPDMPVRWVVFPPGNNNRLIIATEAGVYTSGQINGSSTAWTPSLGFPTVRTDMIRVRAADNMMVASTHGRGLWSANTLQVLPVRGLTLRGTMSSSGQAALNWTSAGATAQTQFHVQFSSDGIQFKNIAQLRQDVDKFNHYIPTPSGFYRVVAEEAGVAPVVSNTVLLRNANSKKVQITVAPNPVSSDATMLISGLQSGKFTWQILTSAGQLMQQGIGQGQSAATLSLPLKTGPLPAGTYLLRIVQGASTITTTLLKQ